MKHNRYLAGLIFLCVTACYGYYICAVPWRRVKLDWSALATYSDIGAWLQGVLIPVALGVAAITFWFQAQSQNKTNRIATAAVFIDNLDRFAKHLHYRCACALVNDAPLEGLVNPYNCDGLTAMIQTLKRKPVTVKDLVEGRSIKSDDVVYGSRYYRMLQNEIEQIYQMGKEAALDGLLDGRIRTIRDLIKQHPPTAKNAE